MIEDADLITSNASMEHIKAMDKLRLRTLEEFRKGQQFRDDDEFLRLAQILESKFCKAKLENIISVIRGKDELGSWLFDDPHIIKWINAGDDTCRFTWLQGIPGAGLSVMFLCSAYFYVFTYR